MVKLLNVALCSLFITISFLIYGVEIASLDIHGKADLSPTLLSVDILKSGKTEETLHMIGLKGDATIATEVGFCIKPSFLVAEGKGKLSSLSMGVGQFIPVGEKWLFIPSIGISFSYLRTKVDIAELGLLNLKEKFHSTSPFIALEVCYKVNDKLTLLGMVQYAWSRTHTTIGSLISDKSRSCGPNYSIGFDYSLNKHWSIVGGFGYNVSLSKEKHGIRGKGAKLGLAYYY